MMFWEYFQWVASGSIFFAMFGGGLYACFTVDDSIYDCGT